MERCHIINRHVGTTRQRGHGGWKSSGNFRDTNNHTDISREAPITEGEFIHAVKGGLIINR